MNSSTKELYTGLKARLIAFFIDFIIVIFPVTILTILFLFLFKPRQGVVFLFIIILPLFSFIVYFSVSGVKTNSLGKKYMNLLTLDKYKMKLTPGIALLRSILKTLLGWISWISIPGSEKKYAIHDIFLKTNIFYENEKNILKNDNEDNRIMFIKKAQSILPVVSILIFIILFIFKINLTWFIQKQSNALLYLIYLLIPGVFFTSLSGLVISIQAKMQNIFEGFISTFFIVINAVLCFIFIFFFIRTILIM